MITLPDWLYMKVKYKAEDNSYYIILETKYPHPLVYKGNTHERLGVTIQEDELQEVLPKILYKIELESGYL